MAILVCAGDELGDRVAGLVPEVAARARDGHGSMSEAATGSYWLIFLDAELPGTEGRAAWLIPALLLCSPTSEVVFVQSKQGAVEAWRATHFGAYALADASSPHFGQHIREILIYGQRRRARSYPPLRLVARGRRLLH